MSWDGDNMEWRLGETKVQKTSPSDHFNNENYT